MAFQIPEAEIRYFEFELEGETLRLPAYDSVDADLLERSTDLADTTKTQQERGLILTRLVFDIFDRYLPGLTARLKPNQAGALIEAYMNDARTAPGESQASSD